MLLTADALASAFAMAKGLSLAEMGTPRRQLQSALSGLFAEPMGLMVEVQRAAVDDAAELPAAQNTLNGNTADLAGAIGALYGPEAAQSFLGVWAGHVEGLVDYATAVREDDDDGREAALRSLDDYAGAARALPRHRDVQRLAAIEDRRADRARRSPHRAGRRLRRRRPVPRASALDRGLPAHVHAVAHPADAIGDEVAAGLPRGGPRTGGGGAAPH